MICIKTLQVLKAAEVSSEEEVQKAATEDTIQWVEDLRELSEGSVANEGIL